MSDESKGAVTVAEIESDRDRLADVNAELQAEIDRINDAQAASLGAEIVRLTAANAAQAREIERLRTLLGRAKDELNSGPLEDRDALYELVTNAEPSWGEDAWAWKFRTDELCREIGAALAPAADASGEAVPATKPSNVFRYMIGGDLHGLEWEEVGDA